jgi:ribosomal protein L24E
MIGGPVRDAAAPRCAYGLLATALVVAATAVPTSALAAGASATLATPNIVQHQTGNASGVMSRTFTPVAHQSDSGSYVSTGQLGSGRYAVDVTPDASLCTHTGDRMSVSGTATLTRSDGATVGGSITGNEPCFAEDHSPATFDLMLTLGSRDLMGAHLAFTGTIMVHLTPGGEGGTESFHFTGSTTATHRIGYWMVGSDGRVSAFGGVDPLGSTPALADTAVHIEATPTGNGYWIVDVLGEVFAFGDAAWYGNANRSTLALADQITSISATPSGHGYWLFTSHGRVLLFGDAQGFGDLHTTTLNGPVIGSAVTPTGHGYYMVANDGGVFAFGDAKFHGSMGAAHLNLPVIGLVPTASNDGYWLVAADGGVFSFNAPFLGSMGRVQLSRPVIGGMRYGTGYMMVAQDGGIFDFSDQLFFGSLGASPPASPIVGVAGAA